MFKSRKSIWCNPGQAQDVVKKENTNEYPPLPDDLHAYCASYMPSKLMFWRWSSQFKLDIAREKKVFYVSPFNWKGNEQFVDSYIDFWNAH
jgi:hypothetical protein